MESDPMDIPPNDHGSDRYDYVEVDGPEDPSGGWFDKLIAAPCPDCRANVFLRWRNVGSLTPSDRGGWDVTIAHDEGCPSWREGRE